MVLLSCQAFAQVDVTFKVDMRGYTQPFLSAYVNGSFNAWCGSCNAMTDANNDSIWEATISLPAGSIEYKFTVDGWTAQETLTPGSTCTVTNFGFTNRSLTFTSATVLPVVCWGTCGACGPIGPTKLPIKLPITWQDSATTNLSTVDFGGTFSTLAPDPVEPSRLALKVTKGNTAESWAGTTLGTTAGFVNNIPFASGSTQMQAMVYSPAAGMTMKLKAEDKMDPTKSVETDAVTTTANAWEVLTFNFNNQSAGTAAINFTYNYNKLSFFPNFGVTGAVAGEQVFYLGQVAFGTVTSNTNLLQNKWTAVYPNPANGALFIQNASGQSGTYRLMDILGQEIASGSISSNTTATELNVQKVGSGIYLLEIEIAGKRSIEKVQLNK